MEREDYFMENVNINTNELYQIFDNVAIEMFRLLNFAYTRFIYTKEYQTARTTLTKSTASPVSFTVSE